MRVGHMRTADPLSFAKYTESLIHVNKTYINLTQPSIGRQLSLEESKSSCFARIIIGLVRPNANLHRKVNWTPDGLPRLDG